MAASKTARVSAARTPATAGLGGALSFDTVKVFSATMARQREQLGEQVTDWLAQHPGIQIADIVITQSSDSSFHCVTLSIFFRERRA